MKKLHLDDETFSLLKELLGLALRAAAQQAQAAVDMLLGKIVEEPEDKKVDAVAPEIVQ